MKTVGVQPGEVLHLQVVEICIQMVHSHLVVILKDFGKNPSTCFDSEAGKRKKKKGTEPSILVNTKEELVCRLTGSGVGTTYLMEFFALQHS